MGFSKLSKKNCNTPGVKIRKAEQRLEKKKEKEKEKNRIEMLRKEADLKRFEKKQKRLGLAVA